MTYICMYMNEQMQSCEVYVLQSKIGTNFSNTTSDLIKINLICFRDKFKLVDVVVQ